MKVVNVISLQEYKLKVSFEDGVSGLIDLKTFVQNGIFSVLKNEAIFNQVKFTSHSIFWNDDLEIDVLNVYAELVGKNPTHILSEISCYASN